MTNDEAIRELIRVSLGMPVNSVRPANQNAPSGGKSEPYATVLISEYGGGGFEIITVEDEPAPSNNVLETVDGWRTVSASVQFFRAGALTQARRLGLVLNLSRADELMQLRNLGLVSIGPVMDLTQVIDTYFEERAQVTLEFNVSAVETASVATFGTFPISVTTPAGSVNFEVS